MTEKRTQLGFCLTCGECLGEAEPGFVTEHVRDFPDHRQYFVKTVIDPLQLPEDELTEYCSKLEPYHPVLATRFGHHLFWTVYTCVHC